MKNVKRLFITFTIVLLMVIVHTSVVAYADNGSSLLPEKEETEASVSIPVRECSIENHISDTADYSSASISSGIQLSDFEKALYNELKANVTSVANGTLTSTKFAITSDLSALSWTKEEIGCTILSGTSFTASAWEAVAAKLAETMDISTILQCLLADCPYELFWYDKTIGISYNYNMRGTSDEIHITSLTISFCVSEDYRSGSASDYKVNLNKIVAANNVLATAKAIVAKYKDQGDLEKLKAYKDEICTLVSYNFDAAKGDYAYGDPWQLIYVFDGDPDTNVVCEGYSKAFKYLCDLSTFDNDIYCYLTRGIMAHANGIGAHMWNVVAINGSNYLADVTSCDNDAFAQSTSHLFLKGGEASNAGQSYTITCQINNRENVYIYSYYENQSNLFCNGYLSLSASSYHEHSYSSAWASNDERHWHECSCGDKIDISNHISSSSSSATCSQRIVCSICDAEYGELLPHIFDQQIATDEYLKSSATCTAEAVYYYSCACGEKGNDTFEHGDLLPHNYNIQNVENSYLKNAATCTTKAIYYCSCVCGAKGTATFEFGKLLQHNYNGTDVCGFCGFVAETEPPKVDEIPDNNSESSDNNEPSDDDKISAPDNAPSDNDEISDPDNAPSDDEVFNDGAMSDNENLPEQDEVPDVSINDSQKPETFWEWCAEILLIILKFLLTIK